MNDRPLVLVVDDEPMNLAIIEAALDDLHDLCFAASGEEALEVARQRLPDLILLDVMMPGMDGYEACRKLKQDALLADVPVIFTTGLDDEDAESRGLALGAIDYVTKPINPTILRARIRNHIELKRLRDQLAELAVTDALTGLGNRRRLEQVLAAETARLARSGDWFSVIMIDIDHFKAFNDSYGHPAGDRCIAMVAAALNRAVRRSSDLIARYGGEEFACALPATDPEAAMTVARDIQAQVRALAIPHERSATAPHVTLSIGVATARCHPGMAADQWVRHADRLLYRSKSGGRNRIEGETFGVESMPVPAWEGARPRPEPSRQASC